MPVPFEDVYAEFSEEQRRRIRGRTKALMAEQLKAQKTTIRQFRKSAPKSARKPASGRTEPA